MNDANAAALRAVFISLTTVLDAALDRPIEAATSSILRGAIERGSFDRETAEILRHVTDVEN
jgi:hypothetical protein